MGEGHIAARTGQITAIAADGKPTRSFAGTAAVVAYAQQLQAPITIIWPPGAARAFA